MNLATWLERAALARPDAPALFEGDIVRLTYAELASCVASRAGALRALGVAAGDRVMLWMSNRPAYLIDLYAIHHVGAIAVPANAKLHPNEVAWISQDCEATLVIADAPVAGVRHALPALLESRRARPDGEAEAIADRGDEDLAWLFYTSGTTGRPKGVMLTNRNLVAMSLAYLADVDWVEPDDAALYAAPMSHGAGLYNYVHMLKGARHIFPPSGRFDADEVLDLSVRLGRVSMFAAPTMVRRLTDAAQRRGSGGEGIRTIVYGGGPMYLEDIKAALETFGPRFVQIYGQGESPMTITALSRASHDPSRPDRLASVGRAHSPVDVRIRVDDDACLLGTAGEIEVRGATVMAGYWRAPEATRDVFRDGWLRTGDIGRVDSEGFLTLVDRSNDLIVSGGSNIYPREIEEVLLTHPGLREVAVFGMPDLEWGEVVIAVVVPNDGEVSEAALDALCLSRLARFKRPKRYVAIEALPKNNYGKVSKAELRTLLATQERA